MQASFLLLLLLLLLRSVKCDEKGDWARLALCLRRKRQRHFHVAVWACRMPATPCHRR